MAQNLDFLKQLAHGMAVQFGSSCEVVIHDLSKKDLENSIVYIENGHVSNRHTGDGPSGIVLETLRTDPEKLQDRLAYLTGQRTAGSSNPAPSISGMKKAGSIIFFPLIMTSLLCWRQKPPSKD